MLKKSVQRDNCEDKIMKAHLLNKIKLLRQKT